MSTVSGIVGILLASVYSAAVFVWGFTWFARVEKGDGQGRENSGLSFFVLRRVIRRLFKSADEITILFVLSLLSLCTIALMITTLIVLDGKWPYYRQAMFREPPWLDYRIPLGILPGILLYYLQVKVMPIVVKFCQRGAEHLCFWASPRQAGLVQERTAARKAARARQARNQIRGLSMYSSNGLVLLMVVVNFCEEVIYRGFLITTVSDETGSIVLAVGLSTFLYSVYHFGGFGGSHLQNALTHILNGIVFALAFVFTGDVVFPFVVHVTFNLALVYHTRKMLRRLRPSYPLPDSLVRQ